MINKHLVSLILIGISIILCIWMVIDRISWTNAILLVVLVWAFLKVLNDNFIKK